MPITIKDVAKIASVSPSTVSRVISNNPSISEETRKRVFQAMEALDYRPNAIARSLANRRTNTLGLIIPNSETDLFDNPFFIRAMRGISIYSQKSGYHIMYTYTRNEAEELKFLKDYVHSNLVDGIILMTTMENDACIEYLKNEKFPFVVIGRPEKADHTLWVDNDNFQAMYNMVNLLVNEGVDRFAYIGGSMAYNFSKDRFEGFRSALNVRGISIEPEMVIHEAEISIRSGYVACEKIFSKGMPAAIVTTDDLLGHGALNYLETHDIEAVRVTGFNNISMNEFHKNLLTSVDINSEMLGYKASKLLIENLKNTSKVNHYIIETKIVER
ncbi:LacI family DNA-binding transcriptional regulator [Fusibacter sp. 3D3]|uniref:LacI family DNA-binding transcriptional regulator n=1 Tax=Fusibacter sp. 3D3 TaxID=1048380 RepID=UPI0008530E4A|nr:LacI family DNA-binding transcriptional regulator [Fusibacter sp. 3D3]GAU76789.1 maltose operon transcriptional repressor MalR [Fusibacter sp. 3D3]